MTASDPAPTVEVAEIAPIRPKLVLAERYAVQRIIGRGGMGIVVRARDRTLDETVAIKILRTEYTGERVWSERLAREVKLARQIQHPNVCRMFDFEQADGRVFLVMELAEGGSLRDEILAGRVEGRSFADRLADARAVAAGLLAIHDAGIVHRDLSPQNVLRMADGRLVLSDFGLATDRSESTTSLHGGTVAYMAPEILRGWKATVASDVWSLGVVIFEAMFGDKPRWRGRRGTDLVAPALARPLSGGERAVLAICRAATAPEAGRRPSARQIAAFLAPGALNRPDWRRRSAWAAAVVLATAAIFAAPTVAERLRGGAAPPAVAEAEATDATPVIELEGEAADWSRRSVVLGEVPDRIPCVLPLPDHRSVRFVWGRPARAEDLDTSTGRRSPSPVVPTAYAEGCPDLSPDGRRLLYLGHVADGRAFAFVADNPEGRDAVPTVATAEPTYRSEPRWRPDGKAFFYEADMSHTGLYSLVAKRSTILPLWEGTERSGALAPLRWMAGDRLFAALGHKTATEIIGVDLTSLETEVRLQLSGSVLDLQAESTDRYWAVSGGASQYDSIFGVDLRARRARQLGRIPGEMLRGLVPVENGLFFWSRRDTDFMVLREGGVERSVKVGSVLLGTVARCGARLLTSESDGRSFRIAERKETGELVRYLTEGPLDRSVSCGATGRWYYVRFVDPANELIQCDGSHCVPLTRRHVLKAQVSPDGTKIALVLIEPTGPAAAWIEIETPEQVHMIGQIETVCSPVWSSAATVWFSRRRGEVVEWIETDLSSGRTTGRRHPGTIDCASGIEDPEAPGEGWIAVRTEFRTQLRFITADAAEGRERGLPR